MHPWVRDDLKGDAMTDCSLTKRESAALALFETEGECNEGLMADLWPLIRNPRLVTNSLVAKGLVTLGQWWDEGAGYELHLTDAGRAASREVGA